MSSGPVTRAQLEADTMTVEKMIGSESPAVLPPAGGDLMRAQLAPWLQALHDYLLTPRWRLIRRTRLIREARRLREGD